MRPVQRNSPLLFLSIVALLAGAHVTFAASPAAPSKPVRRPARSFVTPQAQDFAPPIVVTVAHKTFLPGGGQAFLFGEGEAFAVGEPVLLNLRLANTLGRGFYIGDTGRVSDWHPTVDWLGAYGNQIPEPVRKTDEGVKELGGPGLAQQAFLENMLVRPGEVKDFGPVAINQLFEMTRRGVYVIRVSQDISFASVWTSRNTLVSVPVRLRVK